MPSNEMPNMVVEIVYSSTQLRQVNSSLLAKHSSVFRESIQKARNNGQHSVIYKVMYDGNRVNGIPVLLKHTSQTVLMIKKEMIKEDSEFDVLISKTSQIYDILFDLVEGKASTMAAISEYRLDNLITLAGYFDLIPFIRNEVKLHFMERPKALYNSIIKDPPLFLKLSVKYQYGLMFREALIHCAGGYPGRQWPTKMQSLDPELQAIVIEKGTHLSAWARRVEVELFLLTFESEGTNIAVTSALGKGQRELINLFREWLAEHLRRNQRYNQQYERAVHFWRIWQRGDAYLPLAEVSEHFKALFGTRCQFDLQTHLGSLKETAQKVAGPIAAHTLDYCDREESGIDYLTCLHVEEKDYPWSRQAASGAGA